MESFPVRLCNSDALLCHQYQSDTSRGLNLHIRIIGKELAEFGDKYIQATGCEKIVFRIPATGNGSGWLRGG